MSNMEITNYDLESDGNDVAYHHDLLPNSIRCVICGPSGCGKTNLLLNLLMKYLKFNSLHIYSRSLNQPKYEFLHDWATSMKAKAMKEIATFHSNSDDIIPVEKVNKDERCIMVFDDVMLEKQGPIEKYFCQGRHGGADCFYLCQSYFRIPKQAIRDNANIVILFKQDSKNLRAIHDTFISGDMEYKEFQRFFIDCVSEPFGFCIIDLTSEPYAGKYRSGFKSFYIPTMYA